MLIIYQFICKSHYFKEVQLSYKKTLFCNHKGNKNLSRYKLSLIGPRKSSEVKDQRLDQFQKMRVDENDSTLERCQICLGDFMFGDKMVVLSCGHYYHKVCMIRWLDRNPSCPHCRKQFVFDDNFVYSC